MVVIVFINSNDMKKDIVERINLVIESGTVAGNLPDTGAIASDDDTSPGSCLLGLRLRRQEVPNRLTGSTVKYEVDNNYKWNIFPMATGMEDPDMYDQNIVKDLTNRISGYDDTRYYKHINRKGSGDKIWGTIAYKGVPRPTFNTRLFIKDPEGQMTKVSKELGKAKAKIEKERKETQD